MKAINLYEVKPEVFAAIMAMPEIDIQASPEAEYELIQTVEHYIEEHSFDVMAYQVNNSDDVHAMAYCHDEDRVLVAVLDQGNGLSCKAIEQFIQESTPPACERIAWAKVSNQTTNQSPSEAESESKNELH